MTSVLFTRLFRISINRRAFSTSMSSASDKVAVVLSGCGVYDGTEIHEAAATLAALTRHGFEPIPCAPQKSLAHVVDHTTGAEASESRKVDVESARIARGAVANLTEIKASDVAAIVFPGGFGAAKNLSDFGFKGADMSVDPEVIRVLEEFHSAKKPIGLCCIAPVIAAKVFGEKGVKVTLGRQGDESSWPFGGALDAARSFGAEVVEKDVNEVCIDEDNLIITTPAFMYAGKFHEIQDGVSNWISELARLIKG